MNTLFAKLSLALLGIILLVGSSFFLLERYSNRNYYEEITQRLNASIAMYVTGERQLIRQGVVDQESLLQLAQQAMIINPTVEVYLLNAQGRILGHGMPPESILASTVDLGPVRELIAGDARMPLRGTDPRNLQRDKIFSAFPVKDGEHLEGYLYAILGGQKYDELAQDIRGSYVQAISQGALLAIILAAFLTGMLVFSLMTRRLSQLTRDVTKFSDSNFDPQMVIAERDDNATTGGDEIQQLRLAFGRMAAKIREQFERLREIDRLRRELVTNVSHDLRTPLASMHGYVDTLLLKNDSLSATQRQDYLKITRKHTQRLGQLIGDLFDLSRLEAHSIAPVSEYFSLAELLQDVTREFDLEATQKGVQILIKGGRHDSMVYADIGLIQRVLENLIRNALKYTPSGGQINIGLKRQSNSLKVAVVDTGCGIPEDELEHVFDRYYHGRNQGEGEDESTGLGLAIVSKILDLHGSRIQVQSSIKQGTSFEFQLPIEAAA